MAAIGFAQKIADGAESVNAASSSSERVMLGVLLLAPLLLGMCVGCATRGAVFGWYQQVRKPWFTPPDSAFGPVWSALYLCMGYASFLVYKATLRATGELPIACVVLYVLQLALNLAWTLIFFTACRWRAALAEMCVLWLAIAACVAAFARVSAAAGALMLPYLAFVTLAAGVNAEVIRLNPEFAARTSGSGAGQNLMP